MLIYNIPAAKLKGYQDKTVIIRSDDAQMLAEAFSAVPRENLWSLQILSMDCDADTLVHLSDSVFIDLVLDHPMAEFPRLYRFSELPQKHPVRVTVRAVPGATKAAKVAQALNFHVKLEVNQPQAPLLDELLGLAEYYLRGSTVSHPIEPFHSLFLSFYNREPLSIWKIQEEDPTVDRYVTDDGPIALSRRLASLLIPEDRFAGFMEQHTSICREADECAGCEFFSRCQSYFKLPDKGYCCDQVKRLFKLLSEAGMEMRQDEERFVELHGRDNFDFDASRSPQPSEVNSPDALEKCKRDFNFKSPPLKL